jgi:hypothetical protein
MHEKLKSNCTSIQNKGCQDIDYFKQNTIDIFDNFGKLKKI